ncbi:hypothetical protein Tco_0145335 [Tanacetum coccineum]
MLGTKPNSFYDPNMETSLGYQNSDRLRKANTTQPKLYNAKLLNDEKVKISLYDTKETLEEACHTPRRGLDGIRVQGRDVITIRTQSNKERQLIMDV